MHVPIRLLLALNLLYSQQIIIVLLFRLLKALRWTANAIQLLIMLDHVRKLRLADPHHVIISNLLFKLLV